MIGGRLLYQDVIKTGGRPKCCTDFESTVLCASFAPEWRNWYTHQTQNLASVKDMSVRVRPPAPSPFICGFRSDAVQNFPISICKVSWASYNHPECCRSHSSILVAILYNQLANHNS